MQGSVLGGMNGEVEATNAYATALHKPVTGTRLMM